MLKNTRNVGGIVAKTWPYGAVQDNVTYAKVIKGQEIFASNDVNDEDGGPHIKDLFGVSAIAPTKMVLVKIPRVLKNSNI